MRLTIPVDPDAETARQWARDELAKAEYTSGGQNWLQRFLRWIANLISQLFSGLGGRSNGWGVLITAVIVVAVIGLVVWLVVGPLRRSRERAGDADALVDPSLSAADYADQSRAAAAAGDWSAAVVASYRSLVRGLDERGVIVLRPGMTAHEAAADASTALPEAARLLRQAADLFDSVRYGSRAATREDAAVVDEARAAAVENAETANAPARQAEGDADAHDAQTVAHRSPEADARRFLHITGRTADFADLISEVDGLREHLIVEHEIVRVLVEWQGLEHFARKGAKAGVIFRELGAEHQILEQGQRPVGGVLVQRHAARERIAAQDARAERDIVMPGGDLRRHRDNQSRRILVVGMDHHDYFAAAAQRLSVAGLLVASITAVLRMHERADT